MKEKEKKPRVFFSLSFYSAYLHQKKKSATAGEIIRSHVCISHLYYPTKAFQRTTHHRGEMGHRPERIPAAAPSSGQLTRQKADKEGARFSPELSIRGSLRKWEVLPRVANRLPPTGRESDLMDSLSLQAAMEGMSGHPKSSCYLSSPPMPPQSHKPKEPQLLSCSRQLRHEHCSTSLTILCILKLRID